MRRADERSGATGALQPVQPDHRHARLGFQRVGNFGQKAELRPSEVAIKLQNLRKLRRVTPDAASRCRKSHLVLLSLYVAGKARASSQGNNKMHASSSQQRHAPIKQRLVTRWKINRWKLALQCAGRDKLITGLASLGWLCPDQAHGTGGGVLLAALAQRPSHACCADNPTAR